MVRLRQDYSASTNPFEEVGRVALLPELGGFFGPNYSSVLPYTKRTTLVSNAETDIRLSPHSSIGFTGSYQDYQYAAIDNYQFALNESLMPAHTVNASAFYSQQLSRAFTTGVQYAYFDIYSQPDSRTQAQDLLLFGTVHLTQKQELTIYGGPEYTRSHNFEATTAGTLLFGDRLFNRSWRPAAGATYSWTGARNAIQLQYVRRLSDGGGLMGATSMNNGSAGFRSRLSSRWSADVQVAVSDEAAFNSLIASEFRSTWAGAGLALDMTRNFTARLDYAHVKQDGVNMSYVPASGELVQLSLEYHFVKPVGR
jgi:hypothetical protein